MSTFGNSLASNVEATLMFSLASRLVDILMAIQQQPLQKTTSSSSYDAAWTLAAMCLMLLSLTSSLPGSGSLTSSMNASSSSASQDMLSMLNQTLVLAFSRIVMMQVSISAATSASPLFEYLRRFMEITFVVVLLYAIVKVIPALNNSKRQWGQNQQDGGMMGSIASRQLSTLMINMQRTFAESYSIPTKLLLLSLTPANKKQRTFAETVASIIMDPELRRLIVLWGICILPTISKVLGRFRTSSYFTGKKAEKGEEEEGGEETVMWMSGLGMAWMNTAIGFILPNAASAGTSVAVLWMQVASTLCLAIASRAVQPLLPGIEMFQGYIEWTIATGSTSALMYATRVSSLQLIIATGTLFGILDALLEAARTERAFYRLSATTLQGISAIMFSNSVIAWVVDSVSDAAAAGSSSGGGGASFGIGAVSLTCGIVAARLIVSLLTRKEMAKA